MMKCIHKILVGGLFCQVKSVVEKIAFSKGGVVLVCIHKILAGGVFLVMSNL